MKRIGIITQARMSSSRLPGKVLRLLAGRSVLEWHFVRLRQSGLPIHLATTDKPCDDPIVAFARSHKVECWRGDEQDVLSRFYFCALQYNLDVIIRTTSDCPLIDGKLLAQFVRDYMQRECETLYLCNSSDSYPRGTDFEIFSFRMLKIAYERATLPRQREHVTPYIYENADNQFSIDRRQLAEDKSYLRLTLDTEQDLRLLQVLFERHDAAELGMEGLISLLDKSPELAAINSRVKQKLP